MLEQLVKEIRNGGIARNPKLGGPSGHNPAARGSHDGTPAAPWPDPELCRLEAAARAAASATPARVKVWFVYGKRIPRNDLHSPLKI